VNVLVVADTHLGPGQGARLVDALGGRLGQADAIVHAGDITDRSVLADLAGFAPTYAVLGNNDRAMTLPLRRVELLDGCAVALVHDSGQAAGRGRRLRGWFPDADVVVFGHSHLPWHELDVRSADGHVQHHLNPGSPTQRRRAPQRTVAWLTLAGARVLDIRHDPLD
jgi:uncharacterized protein